MANYPVKSFPLRLTR